MQVVHGMLTLPDIVSPLPHSDKFLCQAEKSTSSMQTVANALHPCQQTADCPLPRVAPRDTLFKRTSLRQSPASQPESNPARSLQVTLGLVRWSFASFFFPWESLLTVACLYPLYVFTEIKVDIL